MRTSDKGIIALIGHEGIVPGPYKDSVGVVTYGVGHTAAAGHPDPRLMPKGMPIDLDAELVRVFRTFRKDLEKYEAEVDAAIHVPISQSKFDAAVSFHFNTGAIARASWVRKLNAGDVSGAAKGIMDWRKPPEIISRRKAEQTLFRNGAYHNGPITVWGVTPSLKVIWEPQRVLTPSEALGLLRGPVIPDAAQEPPAATSGGLMAILKAIFGGRK